MASSDASVRPVRLMRRTQDLPRPAAGGPAAGPTMGRFDHRQYVSMTMEFRCNLKCVHCMIEGTMERLEPQSVAQFKSVLQRNGERQEFKGLILTGSEITLHRDLPEWARLARAHGFEHVRIQTHGMRLSSPAYLKELVEAGVDEFFVSVASADAASHDAITQVPGSFDKTMRGLELIEAYENVTSITNSVVTEESYRQLPALAERLRPLKRLAQMEFWFYFPMNERDEKGLIASHVDALPHLTQAIDIARDSGRGVEVKNFPECLLGERYRGALYNDQPKLLIDPAFWDEFARNGFYQCVHRDSCASTQCLGLNSAYIRKFGDHAEQLTPFPRDR
jgi:MoaA/NifB/PqqE/SkfB family radical SAM enzyme